MEKLTPEELAKAEALAKKIDAKCEAILTPLDPEMRIMGWQTEYQIIVWNTLLAKVVKRLNALS